MSDLAAITDRLRQLATRRPTLEYRAEVVAGLSNKWEGVQAVAAKTLGTWGDRESVEQLRHFLVGCCNRRHGLAIRSAVVQALRNVVTEEDAGWVLDLYFQVKGMSVKHELLWLVVNLPPAAARDRLVSALGDPDPVNRHAAVKALGNMPYPDRVQLIRRLRNDPDKMVRMSVAGLSRV